MDVADLALPENLGELALFADLDRDELEAIVASCEQVSYEEGEWIIRQGDDSSALHMILEGEVATVIDDEDRRILSKGSFFGEVSVLLAEPASASIIARSPVTCLVVPGSDVQEFLVAHPLVTYRLLLAEARRLKTATEYHT